MYKYETNAIGFEGNRQRNPSMSITDSALPGGDSKKCSRVYRLVSLILNKLDHDIDFLFRRWYRTCTASRRLKNRTTLPRTNRRKTYIQQSILTAYSTLFSSNNRYFCAAIRVEYKRSCDRFEFDSRTPDNVKQPARNFLHSSYEEFIREDVASQRRSARIEYILNQKFLLEFRKACNQKIRGVLDEMSARSVARRDETISTSVSSNITRTFCASSEETQRNRLGI